MARHVFPLIAIVLVTCGHAGAARGGWEPDLPVRETRYYKVHTDIDPALARDLERRMDGMYEEYRRRLAGFDVENAGEKMAVYVFRRKSDYLRFIGAPLEGSGGIFMPGRNALVSFLEGQGRDELRRTLKHEAFHQFAHVAISPKMPLWLNEGLAQVFEEGIWTGDGFLLGQVPPRRLRQLKNDLKNRDLILFDEMMSMSHEKWQEGLTHRGSRRGATQYNQCWAMVHFLIQAKDAAGGEKYRRRFIQMLQLLHGGAEGRAAFEQAFSSNLTGFQSRFAEYAHALQATPEATMIERQEVLGDILISLKRHNWTFDRLSDLRDAAVRSNFSMTYYNHHGMRWSTDPDVSVYFSDSQNRVLDERDLYLDPRASAPLPDIVCHATDRLQLRTRFHPSTDEERKIEREVLVEAPGTPGRGN
jgi:hypothetical protein